MLLKHRFSENTFPIMYMHTTRGLNCFSSLELFEKARKDSNDLTFIPLTIESFTFYCNANGTRWWRLRNRARVLELGSRVEHSKLNFWLQRPREASNKAFCSLDSAAVRQESQCRKRSFNCFNLIHSTCTFNSTGNGRWIEKYPRRGNSLPSMPLSNQKSIRCQGKTASVLFISLSHENIQQVKEFREHSTHQHNSKWFLCSTPLLIKHIDGSLMEKLFFSSRNNFHIFHQQFIVFPNCFMPQGEE